MTMFDKNEIKKKPTMSELIHRIAVLEQRVSDLEGANKPAKAEKKSSGFSY